MLGLAYVPSVAPCTAPNITAVFGDELHAGSGVRINGTMQIKYVRPLFRTRTGDGEFWAIARMGDRQRF